MNHETFNTRDARDERVSELRSSNITGINKSTSSRATNGAYFRRYREATKYLPPSKSMIRTPHAMTWTIAWGTDTI